MNVKPIRFSPPCADARIRAILDGRMTQFRVPVKPQPVWRDVAGLFQSWVFFGRTLYPNGKEEVLGRHPYGQPGDLLWLQEAALPDFPKEFSYYDWSWREVPEEYRTPAHVLYRASWKGSQIGWHPSTQMRRWASRLTLHITNVRVERVQEISEDDAMAEGIPFEGDQPSPRDWFSALWDSINGRPRIERDDHGREVARHDFSWTANPFCWRLSFEVIPKNVDEVIRERSN